MSGFNFREKAADVYAVLDAVDTELDRECLAAALEEAFDAGKEEGVNSALPELAKQHRRRELAAKDAELYRAQLVVCTVAMRDVADSLTRMTAFEEGEGRGGLGLRVLAKTLSDARGDKVLVAKDAEGLAVPSDGWKLQAACASRDALANELEALKLRLGEVTAERDELALRLRKTRERLTELEKGDGVD